ncbi:MAG: hypothetical protein A3B14_00840 [Candidatus Zambryskibacteria bacterium RIFCSPLOWO2_01_FULL_45_21]|uniref:Sortase n=1 Tax=Candidatus Zambryskibacteria bacterium RIFCSPLOWO2_01_FULL_45_21 TaxID=1802761 RepID=A0A1G2U0H0_9BACT|nr:MAG: hypothetical protein A3B14_00840 [Candidatus Zambryskibacteria bacterium RIFCSPLOWO2_01_FULL_45_21]
MTIILTRKNFIKIAKKAKKFVLKNRYLVATNVVFVIALIIVIIILSASDRARALSMPSPDGEASARISSSTPEKIIIPAIGVDALIEDVGITRSGEMGTPDKYQNVGWYRYGPTPGSVGNSVMAGHLDRGDDSNPAVFHDLKNLKIDDDIYVISEGKRIQFKVREIGLVDYHDPPLERIFGTTTKVALNLITCDGIWIPEKKTYDERLVVYTEYVSSENLPQN